MAERGQVPYPGRIAVVGTSGSGKTTLAHQLAQRLDVPHVELDAIYWGPNWTPLPLEVFRVRVEEALNGDAWAADGNYSKVRDIVWGRADMVVWLDYPLPLVMVRIIKRTFHRSLTHKKLWGGNQERFWEAFFGRDSIVRWALSTYNRRRREYPTLLSRPEYAHLEVIHLQSPRAACRWLDGQEPMTGGEGQMTTIQSPVAST